MAVYYCSRQGADEYFDDSFGIAVRWDRPLFEGYRHMFLRNLARMDRVAGFMSLVNPAVVPAIWRERYDALWIHGYNFFTFWLAMAAARASRTPIFYRSESSLTFDSRARRAPGVRSLKSLVLKAFFHSVSGFLAIGTLNRDFYLRYGAAPERIFSVPYTVDNDYFREATNAERPRKGVLRAAAGIQPSDTVFLFAAKLTEQKSPLAVLEAWAQLREVPGKALLMVGDGRLRGRCEEFVLANNLSGVRFVGFVNQSQLPQYYAMSDVFVRPDGLYKGDWGLTINEAMAAGLAIISTDAIAATVDLVRDGENGFCVTFGEIDALADAMRRFVEEPGMSAAMGRRSAEIIRDWNNDKCVAGVLEALGTLAHNKLSRT